MALLGAEEEDAAVESEEDERPKRHCSSLQETEDLAKHLLGDL